MKSMKIGLAVLVAVLALAGSASAWTTVDGIQYTNWNGHWYGLTDLGTWDAAQADAIAGGVAVSGSGLIPGAYTGSLVTIDDATENQWLLDNMFSAPDFVGDEGAPVQHLWIGYNDAASEGNFVWADGSPNGYENWAAGEPTNGGGVEDWAAMKTDGKWNDYHTTQWSNYGYDAIQGIIELTPAAVPAPGAILIAGIGTACVGYFRRRRAV